MAKDKVQMNLEPVVPSDSLAKFAQQIQLGFKQSDGAVTKLGQAFGQVLRDDLSTVVRKLGLNTHGVGRQVGRAAYGVSQVSSVASALGPYGAAAAGIYAGGMAAVGTRSPGTVDQFEMALKDVSAVIGETFIPVMEMATDYFHMVGDVLANVLPNAAEMRDILGPLKGTFKDLFDAIKPLLPLFKGTLKTVLEWLVEALSMMAKAVTKIVDMLPKPEDGEKKVQRDLEQFDKKRAELGDKAEKFLHKDVPTGKLYGYNDEGRKKLEADLRRDYGAPGRSSRSMAAQHASYQGLTQAGAEMRAAAFSAGGSPQERTAKATEKMAEKMDQLVDNTKENPDKQMET